MRSGLSLAATGFAASGLLGISFVLCTVFDLILPGYQMHSVWEKLLPGFVWISFGSFVVGFFESIAYGWYFALIWVPIYNVVLFRREQTRLADK
ncbi:MAG TPA: hypothetical protein VKT99_04555 [Xanthobacteraceae bacterium]|nr:hypothetical protein [Xanthobacteraceae bacterium]